MLHKSMIIYASYLFIAGTLFFCPLYPALGPSSGTNAPNKPSAGQLPFEMSEDEMKMLSEFIDSLDQETLDALNAIGEEIIKEADELGIDPFDYIQLQAQMQQEYEDKAAKETTEKGKVTPGVIQPTAEAQTAQDIFKGIAKVVPAIMQKAASDINLSNDLLPFKYRLDDLVYYCTRLADEKMLKYLADPNFKELIDTTRNLYKALTTLNEQFAVAEFSLEGENPYEVLDISRSASQDEIVAAYDKLLKIIDPDTLELQLIKNGKTDEEIKKEVEKANARLESVNNAYGLLRSKEEATYILNKILDAVSEAVDTKKMLEQATKILQLHEPEALKLKKEQEKLEAEARKTQDAFIKKRPITSRAFAMPMPKQKAGKKYGAEREGRAGYTPTKVPKKKETIKPSKVSTAGKGGGGAKPTGKKPEEKKKEEGKKKKGGAKPASKGKPGEPAKRGEAKKPTTSEVATALGEVNASLTAIKKVIKRHKDIINEENPLPAFMTTAFTGNPEEIAKQKEAYGKFLKELSDAFVTLESTIRAGFKKFGEKSERKDELKQYKDEVAERIKKFEKLDKYALIRILFAPNFAPGKILRIKDKDLNMNKEKEELFFTTKPEGEGKEPYTDLIREAYKNVKSKVMPKEEAKKPGLPPAPFIGA